MQHGVGIDLGPIAAKQETSIEAYSGKRVAFDAWNILYQFVSSIRQPDGTPLMDREGRITSHLAGTLYRTSNLVERGVRPVWVFDGEPHVLKKETLAGREARRSSARQEYEEALQAGDTERAFQKAQQSSKLTMPMAQQAKELLRALGVPVVEAPQEGEAHAAWLCADGQVDAVCSQDFDVLLFGAPQLVRNLTVTGRRKLPGKQVWVEVKPESIDLQQSLHNAGLTREQLVDAAILMGTDFNPGVKGIGPKKAMALVSAAGDLDALLDRLADPEAAASAAEKAVAEQRENLADRGVIRSIFLEPAHGEAADVAPGALDRDAVHELMVARHGFSEDRIATALDRFETGRGRRQQQSLFDF